jgi:hypothetical protein
MDFNGYAEDFSTCHGQERAMVDRWFTDDLVVEVKGGVLHGRGEWTDWLKNSHAGGVRETMQPVTVLQDDDRLMAEVDITFLTADGRPDFPLGALRPGEPATWKFFAVYHLRDDKFARLKISAWADRLS